MRGLKVLNIMLMSLETSRFGFNYRHFNLKKKYENLRTTRQKHFEVQTNNEKKVMILDRNVEF